MYTFPPCTMWLEGGRGRLLRREKFCPVWWRRSNEAKTFFPLPFPTPMFNGLGTRAVRWRGASPKAVSCQKYSETVTSVGGGDRFFASFLRLKSSRSSIPSGACLRSQWSWSNRNTFRRKNAIRVKLPGHQTLCCFIPLRPRSSTNCRQNEVSSADRRKRFDSFFSLEIVFSSVLVPWAVN